MNSKITWLLISISFIGCSCTTGKGGKLGATTKDSTEIQGTSSSNPSKKDAKPLKVQEQWQIKFAENLKLMGQGTEGWALFSDSGMGHTGQQMIFKDSSGKVAYCNVPQIKESCELKDYALSKLESQVDILTKANQLPDRLISVFDGINYEYVHSYWDGSTVINKARVNYIVGGKPLPQDYESLTSLFQNLGK